MAEQISGKRNSREKIRQSTSREQGLPSSVESVHLSSEDAKLYDRKSGLSSVNKSSEEYYECDPCKNAGDRAEADGFCTDCNEYLCSTCFRSHSRSKLSKHHVLLSKDEMSRKSIKLCNPCKSDGVEMKAVGYCKDGCNFLCNDCYGDHPSNTITRQHTIVKDEAIFAEDQNVFSSMISKMKVKENITIGVNEEYVFFQDLNLQSDTDEKSCFISSMTFVPDNALVLYDSNNQCLKLVDVNLNIIKDVLALETNAGGITTLSNDQIAIVLENCFKIQLVNVLEKMTLDRFIKTNGYCADVNMNNNRLYVSFYAPLQFQILHLTGALIKTIKPDDEILKHCTFPRHIAVSHDESVIYVSDSNTHKVMSLDIDGHMLSLYDGELEFPNGIITSSSGSVYVCSTNQQIVYKMKSDLSEAMVMLGPGD
jgi:hypothetical protein